MIPQNPAIDPRDFDIWQEGLDTLNDWLFPPCTEHYPKRKKLLPVRYLCSLCMKELETQK